MVQLLWKSVGRLLKMLKAAPSYGPAIPLLGTYPKDAAPDSTYTRSAMLTAAASPIKRSSLDVH